MLIYQPIFDLNHVIFRILLYSLKLSRQPIEIERVRIIDYYFMFPTELKNFSLPRRYQSFRKRFRDFSNTYEVITDSKRIFEMMLPFQESAFNCLVSLGFMDIETLQEGMLQRTDKTLPQELTKKLEISAEKNALLMEILSGPFAELDLKGHDGLKKRSNLMEYRYDSI